MDTIFEIIESVPELSRWDFISLCLASFFTSLVSATFGLGRGAMLVAIMASLLNPMVIITIHAVIQIYSGQYCCGLMLNLYGCCYLLSAVSLVFQEAAK